MASSGAGAGGGKAQPQPQGPLPEDRVPWEEKLGACACCVCRCVHVLGWMGRQRGSPKTDGTTFDTHTHS